MKKVATLTFHTAINVGAVLQAYALQQAIIALGVQSEVIDYRNAYTKKVYGPLYLQHKTIAWAIKTVLVAPIRIARNYRFRMFVKHYLQVSKQVKTDQDFAQLSDAYDTFLVGSDQVWNPYHTGTLDSRYFLDFVTDPQKKKSYAASFGLTTLPEAFHPQYEQLLQSFGTISVRENSAVDILTALHVNVAAEVVLDPVFLLDASKWNTLALAPPKKSGDYLLLFCVNGVSEDVIAQSIYIAKQQGLQVIYLARRPQRIAGIKVVTRFAPREFLGYIKNAQYVVTDSFHATSFSIIFEKSFSLKVASQHGHVNNRSLELMQKLGIHSRLLAEESGDIDWTIVRQKLIVEKIHSLASLKKSIGVL